MTIRHTDEPRDHQPTKTLLGSLTESDVVLFYSFLARERAIHESGGAPAVRGPVARVLARFGKLATASFMLRCDCVGCVEAALRAKYPPLCRAVCDALGVQIVHVGDDETEAEAIRRAEAERVESVFARADSRADRASDAAAVAADAMNNIMKH